jgi:Leucine-rich repeat (LRR) protein
MIKELPEEISELKNLKTLWLRNNKVQKLPKTINDCSKLQYLELFENEFTEFPKHILQHPTLLQVKLSNNNTPLVEPKGWLKREDLEVIILP